MNRCLILLATFNGATFIQEQLESILNQENIDFHILVSDDMSTDNTINLVKKYSSSKITILPNFRRMGSASQNFFRLIRDANVENFDYIAFSDQDDIWLCNKLSNAINYLDNNNVDAYSSNVMAFWDSGKESLIDKSGKVKLYDYLFGSAGPGCTYVFKKNLFESFRNQLIIKSELTKSIKLHDWLLYAYARSHNYNWYVDNQISMKYRQHNNNEFGANSGIQPVLKRWQMSRSGWYRQQILLTAEFCDINNSIISSLKSNKYIDRISLLPKVLQFRKKLSESIFLGIVLCLPGFK
jgi:rhamnosyltransferase